MLHTKNEEQRQLRQLLLLSLLGIAFGLAGGILAKSLALFADAGHTIGDHLGFIVAWIATTLSYRLPHLSATIRKRAGKINTIILFLLPFWILFEAGHRLDTSHPIRAGWFITFSLIGALVNFAQLRVVGKCRCDIHLPLRAHILSDMTLSLVNAAGALLYAKTRSSFIDPALSLVAAGFIWRLALDTAHHLSHPHQH